MQHDIRPTLDDLYSLKVIRAEDVMWKPKMQSSRLPDLFVEVSMGNLSCKTKVAKKSLSPTWDEVMPSLHATASSTISLSLIRESRIRNESIGTAEIAVSDFIGKIGEAPVHLKSSHNRTSAILFFQLDAVSATDSLKQETSGAVQAAASVAHSSRLAAAIAVSDSTLAAVQSSDLYSAVGTLVGKLDSIKRILDGLAAIHPFVSAAWTVASALYGVLEKQFKTDQALVKLAGRLSDILDFALDADQVRKKLEGIHSVVVKLFNQITECCLFIREYTGRGFVGRMLSLGDQKSKIDAFVDALGGLKSDIDQKVNLNTAIVTARVARQVDQLYLETLLKPDMMDVYGRRSCQEGTRVSVLREITDWILTESSQNILWLNGAAGSGKTTIARSIQDYMLSLSRQGAYLRFERGKSVPNGVIRTIAFQLACYDSQIAESITTTLGNSDIKATPILSQFEVLLTRPLTACNGSTHGPVVIILDALDECGDASSRADLLRALEGITRLPSTYRFVVTGRPEADIHRIFTSSAWGGHIRSMEVDCGSDETRRDVRDFLDSELRELSEPYKDTEYLAKWEQNIEKLATMSSGLFVSASTCAKLIHANVDPFAMLQELVSGETRLEELDELYTTVLTNCGLDWKTTGWISRFRDIIGFMLLSKAPLLVSTIDEILGLSAVQSSSFILARLRPLIDHESGRPLYFRHVTISDYFMASTSKGFPWSIDVNPYRYSLAGQCFALMKRCLRFNIAELDSSCYRNNAVVGLKQKLATVISPGLRYASVCWVKHLCDCNPKDTASSKLLEALWEFLLEQLLFWVEVLSLLELKGRDKIFIDASRWLHNSSSTPDMISFLDDARKLLNTFDLPISENTPHIYLSMLPLMQPESVAAAHYYPRISDAGITITHRGTRTPSRRLKTLNSSGRRRAKTVAFSPINQTQLACGYENGAIEVWDIESGEATHVAPTRHFGPVHSMEFTHDGQRLISWTSDSSAKVWNINRHSEEVLGRSPDEAFLSPLAISSDDAFLASVAKEGTIKIWTLDAELAVLVKTVDLGHDPYYVAFRPGVNNRWLASMAYGDWCIRMWNIAGDQTKEFSLADGEVFPAIAFTSDGARLVCGSTTGTIHVRNADNGFVERIISGHTGWVVSLQLSPTTNYLLSFSPEDRMIRLWDIETGAALIEPVVETDNVISAAWSCDGQHIAYVTDNQACIFDATTLSANLYRDRIASPVVNDSPLCVVVIFCDNTVIVAGRDDGAVIMWRMGADDTWEAAQICDRHHQRVSSIAISSDETQLATSSSDGTCRIWSVDKLRSSSETDPLVVDVQTEVKLVIFSPSSISGPPNLALVTEYSVRIHNSETGSLTTTLSVDEALISAAYSQDGTKLAIACRDGRVRLLSIETGALADVTGIFGLGDASFHIDEPVTFSSSNGNRIVSASCDGFLRVWDTESEKLLLDTSHLQLPDVHDQFRPKFSRPAPLVFSADSTLLLAGNWAGTIEIWDTASGKNLLKVPRGHTQGTTSAMFSANDSLIVSASDDGTVRIWDAIKILSPGPDLKEDGWLVDEQGRLLLWIPSHLRPSLLRDYAEVDVLGLGLSFSTRVDLSKFREDGWRNMTWTGEVERT
ncbi:WD40-repeat-containing domain protein [Cytidiella melzeri]|nr:WD40-repeat-containing domain protein [Cytidiella melzeri]